MTIVWTDDWAGVDWQELEALYRAAPLGNKNADDLCKIRLPADEDRDGDVQEPAIGDRQGAVIRGLIVSEQSRLTSSVMPAQAGIQYSMKPVMDREATAYWIVRFRGR